MEWRPQLALANLTPPNTNLLLIPSSTDRRSKLFSLTLFKNLTNEQISLPAVGSSRYTEVMNSAQADVLTCTVVAAAVAAVGVTIANIVHLPPRSLKGLFAAAVAAYSR